MSTDDHYQKEPCTDGDFSTEDLSAEAFDAAIEEHCLGLFRSYKEVSGWYTVGKAGSVQQRPRIDRILIPTAKLKEHWKHGAIGVEIKKSGTRLGRPACQCIDYRQAVFEVEHCFLSLNQIFLWPLSGWPGGSISSVMCNYRIGSVFTKWNGLRFGIGGSTVLQLCGGSVLKSNNELTGRVGNKRGSR